jgi:tetratricopeptide (TPR) repeat protein
MFTPDSLELQIPISPLGASGSLPCFSLFGGLSPRLGASSKPTLPEHLLAYLLAQPNLRASRTEVSAVLYPDGRPVRRSRDSGYNAIQENLKQLKKALLLVFPHTQGLCGEDGGEVYLNPKLFIADITKFRKLVQITASQVPHIELVEELLEAVERYQSEQFLQGWNFGWCEHYRDEVHQGRDRMLKYLLGPCRIFLSNEITLRLQEAHYQSKPVLRRLRLLVEEQIRQGRYREALMSVYLYGENHEKDEAAEIEALEAEIRRRDPEMGNVSLVQNALQYVEKQARVPQGNLLRPEHLREIIENLTRIAEQALDATLAPAGINDRSALDALCEKVRTIQDALTQCQAVGECLPLGMRLARTLVTLWSIQGNWVAARTLMGELVEVPFHYPPSLERVLVLDGLGILACQMRDFREARELFYRALGTAAEIFNPTERLRAEARLRISLAFLYQHQPETDLDQAEFHLTQAQDILATLEDKAGVLWGLHGLGKLYKARGEKARAKEVLRACVSQCALSEVEPRAAGYSYQVLAEIEAEEGDYNASVDFLHKEMRLFQKLEDTGGIAAALDGYINHALAIESWERAAVLLGACNAWRKHIGVPGWETRDTFVSEAQQQLRQRLIPELFESATTRFMQMPEAIDATTAFALGELFAKG